MGSTIYISEKNLKNAATQVYKVRKKLYNDYVRDNKRIHRKKLYTESRKKFKKLEYFSR